jgi:hypothetical protein
MIEGINKPLRHICAESIRPISLRAVAGLASKHLRNVVVVHDAVQSSHAGTNLRVSCGCVKNERRKNPDKARVS